MLFKNAAVQKDFIIGDIKQQTFKYLAADILNSNILCDALVQY